MLKAPPGGLALPELDAQLIKVSMLRVEVVNEVVLLDESLPTEVHRALMLVFQIGSLDLLLLHNSSLNSHFKASDIDLLFQDLVRLSFPGFQPPLVLKTAHLPQIQGFLDLLGIIDRLLQKIQFFASVRIQQKIFPALKVGEVHFGHSESDVLHLVALLNFQFFEFLSL
jgi:hypothetical protein